MKEMFKSTFIKSMNSKSKSNNIILCVILMSLAIEQFAWASIDLPDVKLYGFLLPTIIGSSGGVATFGHPNASGFTAAANPMISNFQGSGHLTFQASQSRFGFLIGDLNKVGGRFEFDFSDFTKASPSTRSLLRLRRAYIQYHFNDSDSILVGQDWDIITPVHPITYNYIGHYFESGDAGFMRQQMQWMHKVEKGNIVGVIGLPGSNNSSNDSNLELSMVPTFGLRAIYTPNQETQIGIAGIATSLLLDKNVNQRTFSYALALFGETKLLENHFRLNGKAYAGRSLSNLGTLSLSYASTSSQTAEAGGWVTGHYALTEKSGIFGGLGYAEILNPESITPGYQLSGGTYTISNSGPGIQRNGTVRMGFDYKPEKYISLFVEGAYLITKHKLLPSDLSVAESQRIVWLGQTGMMLSF